MCLSDRSKGRSQCLTQGCVLCAPPASREQQPQWGSSAPTLLTWSFPESFEVAPGEHTQTQLTGTLPVSTSLAVLSPPPHLPTGVGFVRAGTKLLGL